MRCKILFITLLCYYPISGDYVCVCSSHIAAKIYRVANIHTEPIGTLYPDVGECKPAYNDTTHPNFVALVHYHEIGYVLIDKDIKITNCVGHPNSEDLITTLSPYITLMTTTLYQVTHSVTPKISVSPSHTHHQTTTQRLQTVTHSVSHKISVSPSHTQSHQTPTHPLPIGCNKVALFMDIALDKNVGTAKSHHCADNIHFDADAVVTTFCGAPDKSMWIKGRNVLNAASVIPKYSPIGTFDRNNIYKGSASVFLGYINNTIYLVTQSCHSNLEIHEVTASPYPNKQEYFEIFW